MVYFIFIVCFVGVVLFFCFFFIIFLYFGIVLNIFYVVTVTFNSKIKVLLNILTLKLNLK